jgi:hypothetical protein
MCGRMAKHPHLTSDQVVLRALRELCKGAGERLPHPKYDSDGKDPESTELPSSVRTLRPEEDL